MMKLLTDNQNKWLRERNIEVGDVCSIPNDGFPVYEINNRMADSTWIEGLDINMRRTDVFRILDKDEQFYKINLAVHEFEQDFYIPKAYLEVRSLGEFCMLWIFCIIPFMVYNLFTTEKQEECNETANNSHRV